MEPEILFAMATSVAHFAVMAPVTPLINKFQTGFAPKIHFENRVSQSKPSGCFNH